MLKLYPIGGIIDNMNIIGQYIKEQRKKIAAAKHDNKYCDKDNNTILPANKYSC